MVQYMHAAAVLPVKSTWLKSIIKENFETWPGLTYSNADKYCPHEVDTIKGHMVKYSKVVRPTKKKKDNSKGNKKAPNQATLEGKIEEEDIPPPI